MISNSHEYFHRVTSGLRVRIGIITPSSELFPAKLRVIHKVDGQIVSKQSDIGCKYLTNVQTIKSNVTRLNKRISQFKTDSNRFGWRNSRGKYYVHNKTKSTVLQKFSSHLVLLYAEVFRPLLVDKTKIIETTWFWGVPKWLVCKFCLLISMWKSGKFANQGKISKKKTACCKNLQREIMHVLILQCCQYLTLGIG